MPDPKPLTSDDIKKLVAENISAAIGGHGSDIAQERADLMDRYLGEPYGDEEQDRSAVVSTDVNDVIESILPDMMEIFYGSDNVVKFEPRGPEDEKAAQQETDVVNHVFDQSNGFLVLYSWMKDALILKNGFVKWWWADETEIENESYEGMTQLEIDEFMRGITADGDEVEIVRQELVEGEDDEPEIGAESPRNPYEIMSAISEPGAI